MSANADVAGGSPDLQGLAGRLRPGSVGSVANSMPRVLVPRSDTDFQASTWNRCSKPTGIIQGLLGKIRERGR